MWMIVTQNDFAQTNKCECHNCHANRSSKKHWLCSHENESCSKRRFVSRSKTWLGSWFELRAFTCIANAFPITIRICALRGNILLLLRSPRAPIDPCAYAWLQRAHITFRKSFAFTCPRIRLSTWITIQNALFFRVSKTRFKSLIWNSFAFTRAKIWLSNQERAESRSETSFGTWFVLMWTGPLFHMIYIFFTIMWMHSLSNSYYKMYNKGKES